MSQASDIFQKRSVNRYHTFKRSFSAHTAVSSARVHVRVYIIAKKLKGLEPRVKFFKFNNHFGQICQNNCRNTFSLCFLKAISSVRSSFAKCNCTSRCNTSNNKLLSHLLYSLLSGSPPSLTGFPLSSLSLPPSQTFSNFLSVTTF